MRLRPEPDPPEVVLPLGSNSVNIAAASYAPGGIIPPPTTTVLLPGDRLVAAVDVMSRPEEFHSVVTVENIWTGDGRFFEAGAITWAPLPLPWMAQDENLPAHMESVQIGNITRMERVGNEIHAWGSYVVTDESNPADDQTRRLIARQRNGDLRGVSIDGDSPNLTLEIPLDDPFEEDEDGEEADVLEIEINADTMPREVYHGLRIIGATALPFPAFQEAYVEPLEGSEPAEDDEPDEQLVAALIGRTPGITGYVSCGCRGALTAAAGVKAPVNPPRPWFYPPEGVDLDRLEDQALTVANNGRVWGLVASNDCHVGYRDQCIKAPKSLTNYAWFHLGEVICADGSRVNVGKLTAGTGHAPNEASAAEAIAHYDNTGFAAADVRVYEDGVGRIWAAGAVRPDASPAQIRTMMASPPSGDWRGVAGNLEMVAILHVNVPGFPVRREVASLSIRDGLVATLVASMVSSPGRGRPHPVRAARVSADTARFAIEGMKARLGNDPRGKLRRMKRSLGR